MDNNHLLTTLTWAEADVLRLLLNNPMLDNWELAAMRGCKIQTLKNHLAAIYKKLIPEDIYNQSSFMKRRLYIHLNYDMRFANMPDSWREALIDPLFKAKDIS